MHCTYRRTFGLSINGINSRQHKHKPDQKRQEQNRIEHHPIREPTRSNLHLDEISHPFPRHDCYVPQARRYVELHCTERRRKRKRKMSLIRRFRESLGSCGETRVRKWGDDGVWDAVNGREIWSWLLLSVTYLCLVYGLCCKVDMGMHWVRGRRVVWDRDLGLRGGWFGENGEVFIWSLDLVLKENKREIEMGKLMLCCVVLFCLLPSNEGSIRWGWDLVHETSVSPSDEDN